jgi:hypothetical protein
LNPVAYMSEKIFQGKTKAQWLALHDILISPWDRVQLSRPA